MHLPLPAIVLHPSSPHGNSVGAGVIRLYKAALEGEVEKVHSILHGDPSLREAHVKECEAGTVCHAAAAGGHVSVLRYLLETYGAESLMVTDDEGRTPVHWAARASAADMMDAMVALGGGTALAVPDAAGRPPMHYAARYGNHKQLELLLGRHGVPSTLAAKDQEGENVLHAVARGGKLECAKVVFQCGGPHAQALLSQGNFIGQSPLHLAAGYGHLSMLQYFVLRGIKDYSGVEAPDAKGKTCLHYACGGGHLSVVAYLVQKIGRASVMVRDEVGRIPIFYAAMEGQANVTEYLITRAGAEQVRCEDSNGKTVIDMAKDEPRQIVLRVADWLNLEADVLAAEKRVLQDGDVGERHAPRRLSETTGKRLSEALNQAIANGDREQVVELVSDAPQLLSMRNQYGDLPLMLAAFKGDLPTCEMFVHKGGVAMLRHRNDDGETALHVAVSQDRIGVAEWMIREGGPELLMIQTSDGQTPLHYAVAQNFTKLAKMLVTLGELGQLDMEDSQGQTPKGMARSVDMRTALDDAEREREARLSGHTKCDQPDVSVAAPPEALGGLQLLSSSLRERLMRSGSVVASVLPGLRSTEQVHTPQQQQRYVAELGTTGRRGSIRV